MSLPAEVRRVRLAEWREVRALRIEAVGDADAAIAFLSTPEQELAHDERHWRERTAGAAMGDNAAQFVGIVEDAWVGTATVLLRAPGDVDHLSRVVLTPRADVVGVYVSPSQRGSGLLGRLFDAAGAWAAARGARDLTLDTHVDNVRAQAAYRKCGFAPTGVSLSSSIGPEIEMSRSL